MRGADFTSLWELPPIFQLVGFRLIGCLFLVINARHRHAFRLDELGMEIMRIAFPAALALMADPVASLIDTAFIGHIGQFELSFMSFYRDLPRLFML